MATKKKPTKRKKKPPRKKAQIERDNKIISEMYLSGSSQIEIGEHVGLDQPAVSRSLKLIQKVWIKETTFNLDQAKARELLKIDKIEREYAAAWRRSITYDKKMHKGLTVLIPASGYSPFGNAKFLDGMLNCSRDRRTLLGLDAPKQHRIAGDINVNEIKTYTTEATPDAWPEKEEEKDNDEKYVH